MIWNSPPETPSSFSFGYTREKFRTLEEATEAGARNITEERVSRLDPPNFVPLTKLVTDDPHDDFFTDPFASNAILPIGEDPFAETAPEEMFVSPQVTSEPYEVQYYFAGTIEKEMNNPKLLYFLERWLWDTIEGKKITLGMGEVAKADVPVDDDSVLWS